MAEHVRWNGQRTAWSGDTTFARATLVVLVGLALALRLAAARGDLSIDEVWSLYLLDWFGEHASLLALPLHDNTHPLNTLAMAGVRWIGGEAAPSWSFRLLAVACGAALPASVLLLAPQGLRKPMMLAAALLAVTLPLVQYGSEARGYAPMVLCAVVALLALWRWLEAPTPGMRVLFVAAAVLGSLSHLLFLPLLAALGAMALAAGRCGFSGHRCGLGDLLALFFVPCAVAGSYAVLFLTMGFYGKSEPTDTLASLLTMADVTALPLPAGAPAGVGLVLLVCGAVAGLVMLWRGRRPAAVFFTLTVAVLPALLLGLGLVRYPQPRYLLAATVFALFLCALPLWALLTAGGLRRVSALALLAAFVLCQGLALERLIAIGRGGYAEALATIAARDDERPLRIAGSQDYRIGLLIARAALVSGIPVVYVPGESWTQAAWYVEERPATRRIDGGGCLVPAGFYPHAGLSGQDWALYRRVCTPQG